MGCGASHAIHPFDAEAAAVLMAEAAAAYKLVGGEPGTSAQALTGAALRFGQQFDLLYGVPYLKGSFRPSVFSAYDTSF